MKIEIASAIVSLSRIRSEIDNALATLQRTEPDANPRRYKTPIDCVSMADMVADGYSERKLRSLIACGILRKKPGRILFVKKNDWENYKNK